MVTNRVPATSASADPGFFGLRDSQFTRQKGYSFLSQFQIASPYLVVARSEVGELLILVSRVKRNSSRMLRGRQALSDSICASSFAILLLGRAVV